jgi:predicted ester cyclase
VLLCNKCRFSDKEKGGILWLLVQGRKLKQKLHVTAHFIAVKNVEMLDVTKEMLILAQTKAFVSVNA